MYRNGNKRSRSNRNNNKASKSSTIQPQSFSPYPQYVAAEAVVANFQSVSPYEEIYSCCAEQQQKELIGEELYYYVYQWYPERAGKLTGMLLELDINSLLQMLRDGKFLRDMVERALQALLDHYAQQRKKNQMVVKESEN
ncbi:PABC domain-containing protein [Caerostris darwini]|uniref:PABC domain-containing protein n=1 Tax=Caerostris darwini TaxID=1538125 RepID=A0AAV4T1P3_9ARAC|nr:PABC domain-containing protein [Caerostris darwini]